MADYRLSGYTAQLPLGLSGSLTSAANNCGKVSSSNAVWATARGGSSETQSANSLRLGVSTGATFTINRCFLQFEIPNNLSRLDDNPQLTLYVDSLGSGDDKVFIGSVTYGSAFQTPWSSWTAANAWDSVQTADSAAYYAGPGGYYATLTAGLNTLELKANSGLAKFHCLFGGITSSGIKYITIAVINYTYDKEDNSSFSSATAIEFANASHANAPTLVLRKPWFVNDRGEEFPVDYDYTIRAYDVGVNQKDRSVPQLPFSTAIKGPMSLRGKNVPYKVTT